MYAILSSLNLHRDSYPVVSQGNIRIRPGHDTLVALTATDTLADKKIKNVSLQKRLKTFFPF